MSFGLFVLTHGFKVISIATTAAAAAHAYNFYKKHK